MELCPVKHVGVKSNFSSGEKSLFERTHPQNGPRRPQDAAPLGAQARPDVLSWSRARARIGRVREGHLTKVKLLPFQGSSNLQMPGEYLLAIYRALIDRDRSNINLFK